jgi:hypothetical protein
MAAGFDPNQWGQSDSRKVIRAEAARTHISIADIGDFVCTGGRSVSYPETRLSVGI